jgi:aryl-alcohol dehydrogenase-like predicted oxidoreductase
MDLLSSARNALRLVQNENMQATAEATSRYCSRFSGFQDSGFYRSVLNLSVSSLGLGTYLGAADDLTDEAYVDAILTAARSGINFFDTAINYRLQRSERCIGKALRSLQRDELVVCTKAGFLTPGAIPDFSLESDEVAGGMHCISPLFLEDQIDRSRTNIGLDVIDVFYIHNPETQLGFHTREELEARIRRAFAHLERLVDRGCIRYYGLATWSGFRSNDALNLQRIYDIAVEEGGADHHFRFVQLPFNLNMVEAYVDRPESVLECAARLGVAVVASATLSQGRVLSGLPEAVAQLTPEISDSALKAIQFTRSTPGVSVALVGMSRSEHVTANLGIAAIPPLTREQYMRFYQ